ncbi:hypothetical protein [Paenibacillus methanolicus]|uniref:Copper amine oxidase-like protein n=1 Tax=Paenibacillus methanolicus TaxID=582686 RepID=A0A5S5BWS8_9BACL|nr:hypothetical protein [Paenibacillus methanolicus]TYP70642.1 hypothetical protein BCM02_111148 [Paenibacillus methanolicus]
MTKYRRYLVRGLGVLLAAMFLMRAAGQEARLTSDEIQALRAVYPLYTNDPPHALVGNMPFRVAVALDAGTFAEVEIINARRTPSVYGYDAIVHWHIRGPRLPERVELFSIEYGWEPPLKPGMRIIAVLLESNAKRLAGQYPIVWHLAYYVTDDGYVLSTRDDDFSAAMNGRRAGRLVDEIRRIPPKP